MTVALPPLNAERLWAHVEALAKFTEPEAPWTRRAFTPLFEQSRCWLRERFAEAGLAVRLDAGGNLVGRMEGSGAHAGMSALATGSHCDTVTLGGRFDGIIGVLAGIEIAQTSHETGIRLNRPLEVIDFLSEEPSDYGVSCIGSRAMSGQLSSQMLNATNPSGETLAEGLRRIGGQPDALRAPLRAAGATAAFVELHIEQGPVLESRRFPIGVVTNIVGIRRFTVSVDGQADHSGTTPMDVRRDALVGAAQIIDAAQRRAAALDGDPGYVVATIGRLTVSPNASNAVPARVEMTLEVRSDDETILEKFADDVLSSVSGRATSLGVVVTAKEISRSKPTRCDARVMDAIENAAEELGYRSMRMPSGAGHDAVYMAAAVPVGMIFVPCLNGRSHCPEEWIDPTQLMDGARVLQRTLFNLDQSLGRSSNAAG